MNFIELAEKRYSVRKFDGRPVEKKHLAAILRAAQIAPTAANRQPQRILIVDSPKGLESLKDCTPYHFDAPLALLVCYDTETTWKRKHDGKDSGDVDASIVTTHMMLAAAELGVGSTWVMSFDPQKIIQAYAVPERLVPAALLVMGYPAADAAPSRNHDQRLAMAETVFHNRFTE